MEKKTIKLGGGFNLTKLMQMGSIKPDCSVCATIGIKGARLSVKLESDINNPLNICIGFYNEALSGCFAICEGYAVATNEAAFIFDESFAPELGSLESNYYRLCIAIEYENHYSCFYVQSKNYVPVSSGDDYRGSLCTSEKSGKTLAAYFSKGGRLSAKIVDSAKFYNDFYKMEILSLTKTESGIELKISCKTSDIQLVEFYCVSFNGITSMPLEITARKDNILTAELRFNTLLGYDSTQYIFKAKVNGISVETKWSAGVEINGCSLYEPITFDVDGQKGCISCADAKNTFEFNYVEKYYSAVFSIIVAVYNTEQFVAEAIESVLAQKTSSISKAISEDKTTVYGSIYELILVDDGSTDSSGEICDRYAERYPQIKVIHKENGGVSSARNMGIDAAGGKYLNFLDSDDKFSDNVLSECFDFFEKHYDEVNIISMPIKFFEKRSGDHWLNYKFENGNRIIDFNKEVDKPILSSSSSIFKSDIIKKHLHFDTKLTTGEDCKFIYSIIFASEPKSGVVSKCTYWYRKRSRGESSALDNNIKTRNHYIEYMTELLNWYVECSEKYYGKVPRFVQYTLAQFLQWRFIQDGNAAEARSVLSNEEFDQYKNRIIALLQYIDDDIILGQKKIWREQKMFMCTLKHQCKPQKYFIDNDIFYFINGRKIVNASTCYWNIDFLKIENGKLYIDGFNMSFESNQKIFICVNGEFISLSKKGRSKSVFSLGEEIFWGFDFEFNYLLDDSAAQYDIGFYELIDDHYIQKKEIRFGKFSPIGKKYKKSYFVSEKWIARMNGITLEIKNISSSANTIVEALAGAMSYEKEFINEICKSADYSNPKIKEAVELRQKLFPLKLFYSKITHKQIWLVSDRVNMAGDNGEAFFLYLQQINDPDIDVYFVINDNCDDYERMKQYGKVIVQNSNEHKMMHCLADCVISSQIDEYVITPFYHENTTEVFRDIVYSPHYIFLQHGVTKDDLSDWLNKYKKNLSGFVTAAYPEYQSIIDYDYDYTKKEVWLTGFPRHDRLYRDEKNYITIMPTWRKYLSRPSDDDPDISVLSDGFSSSDYFNFYNRLINDERLISAASEYGYKICFMPHPNIMHNLNDFNHNPSVLFFGTEKPYREIYAESKLVMTDYSSSVMDFAYLRKPIVYCQFDKERFFAGDHVYVEGYFDYETDGFGEVTYDLESVVNVMIEYMKNGCELKSDYRERMDKFFAFNDKNSCERVYRKIKELFIN